jgi:ribonuclease P/MRP protein subunit POP5
MANDRLNILPPTLREKERYLIFELMSKEEHELADIVNAIWSTSLQLFGEVGTSSFNLWIPSNLYDKKRKKGIIKCNHTSVEEVRMILASITEVRTDKVAFSVLGVTGTIKSAKSKFE